MEDAGEIEEMGEIALLERIYTAAARKEGEGRPEREWDVAAEVEEIRLLERVFVEAAVSSAKRAARAARAATPASVAWAAAWAAAAEASATAAAAVAAAAAEASSTWPARGQVGLVGRPNTAQPNLALSPSCTPAFAECEHETALILRCSGTSPPQP